MQASVSDPYHLATYSASSSGSQSLPPVSATFAALPGSEDGWVTLTVQGNGIHILDLASSQPVASHTLGPSTFFSAPAVTTISIVDGKASRRRTFVPVLPNESGSQISSQEIWVWEDDVSQPFSSSLPQKQIIHLPHGVSALLSSPTSRALVALSSEGHLSSLSDTAVISHIDPPTPKGSLVKSWALARSECTFLASNTSHYDTVILRLTQRDGDDASKQLRVDFCDATGHLIAGSTIPLPSATDSIVDATCTPRGDFSYLLDSGTWHYLHLTAGPEPQLSPRSQTQLTLLTSPGSGPIPIPVGGISLLPSTASHVFAASTTTTTTTISHTEGRGGKGKLSLELQIWDLKYGVALASFNAGLPSTVSASSASSPGSEDAETRPPRLTLVGAGSGHAVLTISPPPPSSSSSPSTVKKGKSLQTQTSTKKALGKTSVLIVPFRAPKTSTLSAAMLSAQKQILSAPPHTSASAPITRDGESGPEADVERRRDALLKALKSALTTGSEAGSDGDAGKVFWKWMDDESLRVLEAFKKQHQHAPVPAPVPTPVPTKGPVSEGNDATAEIGGDQSQGVKSKPTKPNRSKVPLPHSFVEQLVAVLLDTPNERESWGKFREIMRYLVNDRPSVTNGMVRSEGGLVHALAEKGDWKLVQSCLLTLPDIPDDEVVRLLRIVAGAKKPKKPKNEQRPAPVAIVNSNDSAESKMDVDPPTATPATPTTRGGQSRWHDTPSLTSFLPRVLAYPLTPNTLRPAIRRHFADDVTALLPVLRLIAGWLDEGAVFDWPAQGPVARVMRTGSLLLGEKKRAAVTSVFSTVRLGDTPPAEVILPFLEAIMDSSFLALIQHPSGREILRKLDEIIKPEVDLTVELGSLSGFLEPFAIAQSTPAPAPASAAGDPDAAARGEADKALREALAKRAHDKHAVVKVYQIEELEL